MGGISVGGMAEMTRAINVLVYTNQNNQEKEFLKNFFSEFSKKNSINNIIINKTKSSFLKKDKNNYDFCFKSLFEIESIKKNYSDFSWIYPATIIGHKNTNPKPNKKIGQIITMGRAGTMFFEEILKKYYKEIYLHATIKKDVDISKIPADSNFEQEILENYICNEGDIFFLYRKNWIEFVSSYLIAKTVGFHHQDKFNYTDTVKISLDINKELIIITKFIMLFFNTLCNFKISNPKKFICLVNYEDLVDYYKIINSHKKINYKRKKQDFFKNWKKIEIQINKFIPTWNEIRFNALDKLRQLNVPTIKNLDELF
jgi:hypothetical protein